MHVIDVNSGNRSSENNQEANALETNLEAAKEIARQLRLRDMGGIIVIDFIDMHSQEHKNQLFQVLRDEMKTDKAKHNILPPSKFGLVQLTRQRVRPETNIKVLEKCPTCSGSGEVGPSILVTDEIENNLRFILKEQNEKNVTLAVHPFIGSFFKQGLPSIQMKWLWKYGTWVKINSMSSMNFLEYQFYNKSGEEISL
jgi:ribonuclease G